MRPSTLLRFSAFSLLIAAAAACSNAAVEEEESPGARDESFANEDKDLYGPSSALSVKITAPLTTLFTRRANGQADPPKPPKDGEAPPAWQEPEFSEPGKLTIAVEGGEKVLDMRVYIRGESSQNDCPFPKLKIDFDDKEQLKKTPFKGHGKFRLNTHCGPGDASARSGMGRVMNGVGPVREELTYKIIRAMGIPTYATRVLAIKYEDTAANNAVTETFGMAMESGDDAEQRFKAMQPALIPEGYEYLDPAVAGRGRATPENLAQVTVAEAFSGNKDWGGTHNVDSFGANPPTEIFQIAQDFDLGAIVLADIARYWKGIAPVTDGQASLRLGGLAKTIATNKDAMMVAYRLAEKEAIAAHAIVSADGATTMDPGFLEAKKRIEQLVALPEVVAALNGDAPDAGAADAGGD